MPTSKLNTPTSKPPARPPCDMDHCNKLIGTLVNALADIHDNVVYDMDNSRESHEQSTITFTDDLGREVTFKVVIRALKLPLNHKVGVVNPMTYVDYNAFINSAKTTLHPSFIQFFNGCMTLFKNDTLMECECDSDGDEHYYHFTVENKTRTFMLRANLECTN